MMSSEDYTEYFTGEEYERIKSDPVLTVKDVAAYREDIDEQ